MVGHQNGHRVRPASRLQWALFVLSVVGAWSFIPPVLAQSDFTSESIRGTWAFSATGTFPPSTDAPAPTTPFALVGLLTFERNDQCAMTFTINAGEQSWDSFSDTCTFRVNTDSSGTLKATLVPGQVAFPPVELFFVIVNDDEMLAIRTDNVVASGVLRRQIKEPGANRRRCGGQSACVLYSQLGAAPFFCWGVTRYCHRRASQSLHPLARLSS
jgi:hypothetical protein